MTYRTQAGNSLSAARRQRNFEEKSSSPERDLQSSPSNSSKIIKTSSASSIHKWHYCGRDTNFFRENMKKKKQTKKHAKERKTGCFQSKVTNYAGTKTRTRTKYQTSCGQNSYLSSFLFCDLKLSINQTKQTNSFDFNFQRRDLRSWR